MALTRNDLITIRQYLLGQLGEEGQQNIEQRLLSEDDLFQELEIAEEELVDEYVAEELSAAERQQFENYFLSTPERKLKLKFAAALHRYVSKKTGAEDATERSVSPPELTWLERAQIAWARQTQWVRIAVFAAAVVIVVGVFWLVRPHRYATQSYATVTLTITRSDRAAGDQATKIKLPLGADALRIEMKLPEALDQAARYRVELLKDNGETRSIERVAQYDQSVVVELPAAQLARGQYALNVYLVKPDQTEQRIRGSYLLTIE